MKSSNREINVDLFAVAPGIWGMKDIFVNVYAVINSSDNTWVLIDAGLKWSAPKIRKMAEILFGRNSRPSGIVLTHGHFDHVGSVATLASEWDVPVYAHHLEMPYLTGVSSYPPPDPTVGGGLMADVSFIYPKGPINIEDRVISLPQEGRIPGLAEWKYIHTPGHAPGHISLFREADKVLIAGDAVVTTRQESAFSVMLQLKKLSGPPKYFTCDWLSASWSVEQLANLEPEVIASGHGRPIRGAAMRKSLHNLAKDFTRLAVPRQGRYVNQPALTDDTGVLQVPPKNKNATASPTLKLLGVSAAVLLTALLFKGSKKKSRVKDKAPGKIDFSDLKYPDSKRRTQERNGKQKIQKLSDRVHKEFMNAKEPLKKDIGNLKDPAKEQIKKAKDSAKEQINKAKDSARQQFNKAKDSAKEQFNDVKEPVKKEMKERFTEPLKKELSKRKN